MPLLTLDYVMKRILDVATLACLPRTMDDAVSRDMSRKAVKFN